MYANEANLIKEVRERENFKVKFYFKRNILLLLSSVNIFNFLFKIEIILLRERNARIIFQRFFFIGC